MPPPPDKPPPWCRLGLCMLFEWWSGDISKERGSPPPFVEQEEAEEEEVEGAGGAVPPREKGWGLWGCRPPPEPPPLDPENAYLCQQARWRSKTKIATN